MSVVAFGGMPTINLRRSSDAIRDPDGIGATIAQRLSTDLVAVRDDSDDLTRLLCFDLASAVKIRCGQDMEPDVLLDPELRQQWSKRAFGRDVPLEAYLDWGQRPYWIMRGGERVGTMGYSVSDSGMGTDVELLRVYVRPGFRRQGLAGRALRHIRDTAFEAGCNRMLVSCEWSNREALRFYFEQGSWLHHWKDEIRLSWRKGRDGLRMVADGTKQRFFVADRLVGTAEPRGALLDWELGEGVDDPNDKWGLKWTLEGTAPLYLALIGWPIVRSAEALQDAIGRTSTDVGCFEDLLLRGRDFERYVSKRGWIVPPPNPSCQLLPTPTRVEMLGDRFDVTLSDGRVYPLPFEVLYPEFPSDQDPVIEASIVGDEVHYQLASGRRGSRDVDDVLSLNHSPQQLQDRITFWRDHRRMHEEAKQRRLVPDCVECGHRYDIHYQGTDAPLSCQQHVDGKRCSCPYRGPQ